MEADLIAYALVGQKVLAAQALAQKLRTALKFLTGALGAGMRRHDALAGMDADIGGEIGRRGDDRVDGAFDGSHATSPPCR